MQRQAEGLDGGRDTEYDDITDLIYSSGTDLPVRATGATAARVSDTLVFVDSRILLPPIPPRQNPPTRPRQKILVILAREIEVEARRERKDVLEHARHEAVGIRRRSLPLAVPGLIFLS